MDNVLSTLNNPLSNFCLWNVLNKRPPHLDERRNKEFNFKKST